MKTSTLEVPDPFADPGDVLQEKRNRIITGGRYRLPMRDGNDKKGGWQRVTNLVGSYADQYGLRLYEIGAVLEGLKVAPHLFEEVARTPFETMTKAQRRTWVERFTERAKEAARANEGMHFGNLRHAQVEADHEGELPHAAPDAYARRHLSLYRAALLRNRLRALPGMQERRVLISELGAIGTLDNVLEDLVTSLLHIADLKTIKRFWSFLEIAAQLACYARAEAMWEPASTAPDADPLAGRWVDMPKVETAIGFVLWMPREPVDALKEPDWEPHVDVYEVDIEAGWETAKLAKKIVDDRSAAKRKGNPRGWLRAAPDVTEVEKYAARFAAVETPAEGSALVAEAQKAGVWCDPLAGEAKQAAKRISGF